MKKFIVGLVLGVAAGWGVAQIWNDTRAAGAVAVKSEVKDVAVAKKASEEKGQGAQAMEIGSQNARGKAWAEMSGLEKLREMKAAAEKHRFQLYISLLSGGWGDSCKCSSAFRALFDLTDEEAAVIDRALADAYAEHQKIAMERAVVTLDAASGSLKIKLPFFVEEGGKIFDQMNSVIGRVLGPERQKILADLKSRDFEEIYEGLGTTEILHEIKKDDKGYTWKKAYKGGSMSGTGTTSSNDAKPDFLVHQMRTLSNHPEVKAWLNAQK